MNWRRGLAFAGIHVVVAVSLIVSTEIPRYSTEKIHSANPGIRYRLAAYQEEGQTVEFTPICEEWRSISWQEKVLTASELPAMILSGWNSDCPPRWSTAGMIGIDMKHRSLQMQVESSSIFCLLIVFQWILLGGLPLIKPRKWWLEPGACITACTLIAVCSAAVATLLDHIEILAQVFGVPAFLALLLALVTWVAWIVLLFWNIAKFGWRLSTDHRKPSGF